MAEIPLKARAMCIPKRWVRSVAGPMRTISGTMNRRPDRLRTKAISIGWTSFEAYRTIAVIPAKQAAYSTIQAAPRTVGGNAAKGFFREGGAVMNADRKASRAARPAPAPGCAFEFGEPYSAESANAGDDDGRMP